MAFLVFRPGEAVPSWAVKVARVDGMETSFAGDERGIEQLREAAPALAHRAPQVLGRSSTNGLLLSVETAAVGDRLTEVLRRDGTKRKPLVASVAAWLVDLATVTRLDPGELEAERAWLLHGGVVPAWEEEVSIAGLLDATAGVPAVLVHSDLGTWNIVSDGVDFTCIDWESTRRAALPLWDLLYFLADACAQMARQARPADRPEYLASLFRGEAELSPLVFHWVRRAAEASGLSAEAVGAIATLGWLHRADGFTGAAGSGESTGARFALLWLGDPRLGVGWSCWR
jgi:hypothetical protein